MFPTTLRALARIAPTACALSLLAGCGHDAPPPPATAAVNVPPSARAPSKKAQQKKQDPAWASCHQSFKSSADPDKLASDVAAMAKGCEVATKMHAQGDPLTGARAEGAPPNVYPLEVQAGHCYRVYGVSADTLQDLDVALVDSAGGLAGEDSTDDVTPVLLEDGAVCFQEADKAHIEVGAGAGGGKFALQVSSD
jgi:hypothetical protein